MSRQVKREMKDVEKREREIKKMQIQNPQRKREREKISYVLLINKNVKNKSLGA